MRFRNFLRKNNDCSNAKAAEALAALSTEQALPILLEFLVLAIFHSEVNLSMG